MASSSQRDARPIFKAVGMQRDVNLGKNMDSQITKKRLNDMTRKASLPDAKEVYVRHCTEEYPSEGFARTCPLIHPDVSLEEFFAYKE